MNPKRSRTLAGDSAAKAGIAKRLREARGPRDTASIAEKIGVSRRTIQYMEDGQIPDAWLYLVRLARDGVDIQYLLMGGNGDGQR